MKSTLYIVVFLKILFASLSLFAQAVQQNGAPTHVTSMNQCLLEPNNAKNVQPSVNNQVTNNKGDMPLMDKCLLEPNNAKNVQLPASCPVTNTGNESFEKKDANEDQDQDEDEDIDIDDEFDEEPEEIINSLVLVDETPNQVLDLLEQLTGKTILRPQELVKNVRINLNSNGPITQTDAVLALESLLSMNGVAVIDMGETFLKAVPAQGVQTQSPKILSGSLSKSRPSQKIYSKIFKLKYLSTKEALAAISAIATKGASSQVALDKSNAIFVVDTLMNLQRIETLFEDMDKPLALQEELLFYPIQYVNAVDIKTQFDALKKGNLKKYLESTTVEADKNSNQIIVLTHSNNKPIIDKIIESLDVDIQPLNKSQVFRLKHAEAKEVAAILKAIVKGIPMPKQEGDTRAQLLEKLRETVAKPQGMMPPGSPQSERGQQFSESLTLEPDERSNAVVVYGTPRDLELVRGLIDEMDVLLAQVRIEVVIAEVRLVDDQVSGLQSFGLALNLIDPGKASNGIITNDNIGGPSVNFHDIFTPTTTNLPGASLIAATLSRDAFNAIFRVAEQNTNIRILSAPMIVTTHNRTAIVKVVRDQPFIGESITDVDTSSNLRNSTEYYKDIGIVLEVTPRIGPNGVVQMEIHQTVKSLVATVDIGNGTKAPVVDNREAESFVSVQDQEVIVLAGLQQRLSTVTRSKLWLLGYLPIIGDLWFTPTSCAEETTELILFIRPHVMNNMDEVALVTCDSLRNNITAYNDVNTYINEGHFPRTPYEEECYESRPPVVERKNPCDRVESVQKLEKPFFPMPNGNPYDDYSFALKTQ